MASSEIWRLLGRWRDYAQIDAFVAQLESLCVTSGHSVNLEFVRPWAEV